MLLNIPLEISLPEILLPEISLEQEAVIHVLTNNNVIVDSVAGSGKTTCSLYIAKRFSEQKILLLTYNSNLKVETREKILKHKIRNLEVHSYHSFCVKYYDRECFTDTNIKVVLKDDSPPKSKINYDLIILDETQDMTPLYYELFCKIYRDNKGNNANKVHLAFGNNANKKDNNNANKTLKTKLCIFGDIKQSIFGFNGADERYITFADQLFDLTNSNRIGERLNPHGIYELNGYSWSKCKLSHSFRITQNMSLFLNNCVLNEPRIFSTKPSTAKPRYIKCNCFSNSGDNDYDRPFIEVKYYLDMGYLPEDIFIIAPSIKSEKTPVRHLENKLKTDLDIQIYVPVSDEDKLDNEILEGKLVFSTFHQTKGLERKVVIVFGFDSSYFEYYKTDTNQNVCPNELYVATTRAKEQLTLFHHYENDYLPFLTDGSNRIKDYCYFEDRKSIKSKPKQTGKPVTIKTSPTDLLRYLPQNVLDECYNLLEIDRHNALCSEPTVASLASLKEPLEKKPAISISSKTSQENGCESVSEITGIAIPSYFELKTKGKIVILDELIKEQFKEHDNSPFRLNNIKRDLPSLSCEELLYIANCWVTHKSKYLFKLYQIDNYDWLTMPQLTLLIENMERTLGISKDAVFEKAQQVTIDRGLGLGQGLIEMNGFVDCLDGNKLYEFKCVQKLEKEHYLQLALYMYQHRNQKDEDGGENPSIVTQGETWVKTAQGLEGETWVKNPSIVTQREAEEDTEYLLYNILTDELSKVKCETESLNKMVEILIHYKYNRRHTIDDETFLKNNLLIRDKDF